jgi:hypothetical protein
MGLVPILVYTHEKGPSEPSTHVGGTFTFFFWVRPLTSGHIKLSPNKLLDFELLRDPNLVLNICNI